MLGINRKQSDYDGRRIGAQEAARQAELIERAGGIVAYLTGPTFHKGSRYRYQREKYERNLT